MKSATIIASLLVSSALASPVLEERYLVTSVVMETAHVTVTASRGGGWWPWGRPSSTADPDTSSIPIPTPNPIPTTTTLVVSTSAAPSPTEVPTTSAAEPSTLAPAAPSNSLSSYASLVLEQHNIHRRNHSVPDLVWDNAIVATAKKISELCFYAHNGTIDADQAPYGQNIGAGAPPEDIPKMITNQMYNDEMMLFPGYGSEPDMSNFESWGHFSQIVWKETTHVGCYTNKCDVLGNVNDRTKPYFTVCNYKPQGNISPHYAVNVLEPLGQPIVSIP